MLPTFVGGELNPEMPAYSMAAVIAFATGHCQFSAGISGTPTAEVRAGRERAVTPAVSAPDDGASAPGSCALT
ncbi:hypothetical protein A5779_25915 [Mycolicibacterium peregrinum]|uniref:Uncharacterized protein n=1 Tax=Mycolicibacterium peregrinum TaxID=43304 RepID=A0A1A0W415_MYCPR|nr:hypothetical protein A5779_25915 [Mycolicibacterium peregrinum]